MFGGRSCACRWSRLASNSNSWAARWVRWWASVSCAAPRQRSTGRCLHLHHRQRRGAHAGRAAVPDADGEDDRDANQARGKKLPFVWVLTHPTTGGVSAWFAFLGDVVIADRGPDRLRRAARDREYVREKLPESFQRPSSCSRRVSSTWSSIAARCAKKSRACWPCCKASRPRDRLI